ncbi:hypothetical protein [Ruminiclostridium josui]|uniref:hypothetical protein n=1 Tax=Ruminiclostridium josui TaxID=1499 RepID=UPI000466EA57|nr:hypothetical protein [Ruminiclostridium josui]
MKKNLISFLALFLIISQLFLFTAYANTNEIENSVPVNQSIDKNETHSNAEILLNKESDLLINKKEFNYKELYSFISNRQGGVHTLGNKSIVTLPADSFIDAKKFVPASAVINELTIINDSVIVGYVKNSKRFIIELFKDGSIRKTISKKDNDVITVYSNLNNSDVKEMKSNETKAETINLKSQTATDNIQLFATTKTVDPKPVSSSYPAYKARLVYSANWNFPALKNAGYPETQRVKIYETMDYYSEANKSSKLFDAATNVVSIASFFEVAVGTATGWLAYAGVILDVYNRLTEACKVINEHSYSFYGGKEGTVYDPTAYNRDVEVLSEWGEGILTLTWQYNSSTGFKDPTWGISSRPYPFLISNSDFANDNAQSYNNNITSFGVWKWGPGQLGY